MIAYKFLRSGRIRPFSAFQWPEPDVWVHAPRDLAACKRGIHACRPRDLPWWLADELWEIELDGHVQPDEHKVIAPAGAAALEPRPLSRVEEHLVMCDWCITYVEQMQATIASLRELSEERSPEPGDSLLAALRARRAGGA